MWIERSSGEAVLLFCRSTHTIRYITFICLLVMSRITTLTTNWIDKKNKCTLTADLSTTDRKLPAKKME